MQAELNKKWQVLEQKVDENLKEEISFYVLRDLINEINAFPLQDVKMAAKVLELLYRIYDNGETKLTDEKDKNNLLEETKKAFVSFAGYGLDKPIKVQDIILNVLSKKIDKNEASEISVKTLSALLEVEGTDTVLNDDGKSISWRRFIIRLSPEVVKVRDRTMRLLFEIVQKNKNKYDLIKNIISAYSSTVHSLEVRYRTDKGLTTEEKTELLDQIKKAIGYLQQIKDLYNDIRIEHLDIWHQISMAVWNPYGDKSAIKTEIKEAKELKDNIWESDNYKLFKLILRPGYKSLKENLDPAKNFKADNIVLLEQIIKFGEKEKSIYGSVRFFFKNLGEKKPEVFERVLKQAEVSRNSYLWYYLGFGFSKIDKSIAFAEKQVKSKNIIHIKAGFDAFYHIYKTFKEYENKPKVYDLLKRLVVTGTALIKKDQKDIFWWSTATSQSIQYLYDGSKDNTKDAIELLTQLLDNFSAEDQHSGYLFNAVADSIFFLRSDIDDSYKYSLKKLLGKYLLSGEPNLNTEELFNVVASKVDPLLLIDFYKKRLTSKNELYDFKRIPFSHNFVFENIKHLQEDKVKEVFEAIADLSLTHQKKVNYSTISKIFIDFASNIKPELGINYAIDWLKDEYLKDPTEARVINAVGLLEDFENYSNEKFWGLLRSVLAGPHYKEAGSRVWATTITGSIDLNIITQKEKVYKEWVKDKNEIVSKFAETQLKSLEKDKKEWLR